MADKILVLNGKSYGKAIEGLGELVTDQDHFFNNPEEYKLVLFTGGEDVSPKLYGDVSPRNMCHYNWTRDMQELDVFGFALKHEIKMTGICRGIQFLNVMSGGKMMHHITGHNSSQHTILTPIHGTVLVNSLHHQMMIPGEEAVVIGVCTEMLSDIYIGNGDVPVEWRESEIEALIYPHTNVCGVQYHPEMMDPKSDGYLFYYNMIKAFLEKDIKTFAQEYAGDYEKNSQFRLVSE